MMQPTFWTAEPLEPIPFLSGLRDVVLKHSRTRMPKWKFRLADDLVVQLQPKPAERRDRYFLFVGQVLHGDGIMVAAFQSCRAARGLYEMRFGISRDGDAWAIRPTSGGWPAHDIDREDRLSALRARVVRELGAGRFASLTPEMMLSPACLVCGKGLTDPASMARWIGPECFGSASLSVPRTTIVQAGGW